MATKLVSIEQLAQAHPAFTTASLRSLIFRAHNNGLADSGAVTRLGRKVLIDEPKFIEWIKSRETAVA